MSATGVISEQQQGAEENEVNGAAEGHQPVEAVRGRSGVRLDAFEQRVLASGADNAEEKDVQVLQDTRVEDQRREDADRQRQQDAQDAVPQRHVAIQQRQ